MSTLVSAKVGKSWTADDLLSFNIHVIPEDPQTFFGVADLPAPEVPPVVWDHVEMLQDGSKFTPIEKGFFVYLEEP